MAILFHPTQDGMVVGLVLEDRCPARAPVVDVVVSALDELGLAASHFTPPFSGAMHEPVWCDARAR